jgi:protein phosphatase 1 regulatory subunit 7
VYFEGTPLQLRQPALYRNKVRLSLPQISQIDASECFSLELFPGGS